MSIHDRLLLVRCFRGFVLPVLEYCSAVWCWAADAYVKLLDRVVSDARFLTRGVFECDIAHRRSVAVLCMMYKIRWTRCTLSIWCSTCAVCDSEGYTRCSGRTEVYLLMPLLAAELISQYRRTFIPLKVSLCNHLSDPVFDVAGLTGFNSRANAYLLL